MSDNFNNIYKRSINNPEDFWKEASEDIFFGLKNPQKF